MRFQNILALHWPMATKVPLMKFAKRTLSQVSKLVPHDMRQKPLTVIRRGSRGLKVQFKLSLSLAVYIAMYICMHSDISILWI